MGAIKGIMFPSWLFELGAALQGPWQGLNERTCFGPTSPSSLAHPAATSQVVQVLQQ